MTLVLGIDTSGDACSVALRRDGRTLAVETRAMRRGHAEAVVPMIEALARGVDVALDTLDVIGVAAGPGSFTGIRTGIATARGLALATSAQAVGVSTLEALAVRVAGQSRRAAPLVCVLETRRSDFYVQAFGPDAAPAGEPAALAGEEVHALVGSVAGAGPDGCVFAGNAVARLLATVPALARRGTVHPDPAMPDAGDIAALAERRAGPVGGQEKLALPPPSPLYLRAPEAKRPRHGGRLRP